METSKVAGSRFLSPFGGQAPEAQEVYVIMPLSHRGELLRACSYRSHSVFVSQDSLHAASRPQHLAWLSPRMDPSLSEALSEVSSMLELMWKTCASLVGVHNFPDVEEGPQERSRCF